MAKEYQVVSPTSDSLLGSQRGHSAGHTVGAQEIFIEQKKKWREKKRGSDGRKGRIKMPAMTSFNHQAAAQGNVQPVVLG